MLGFLILPILIIVPLSFSSGTFLTFPLPGLSLRWYQEFFTSAPWRLSLRNSLIVASARRCWRRRSARLRRSG